MKRIWGIPIIAVTLLSASCAAGDAETDREARTMAEAIASPLQPSAMAYARAALKTPLGSTSSFSVVEATDLPANGPKDVSAHLVFRIHEEFSPSDFSSADPVTACYSLDFNHYGLVDGASRTDCPPGAAAITPPPAPPRAEVPGTVDPALQKILAALPPNVAEKDVRAALTRDMPSLKPDPETHLTAPAPEVGVGIRGNDVGVSFRSDDPSNGIDCLLGSRSGAGVLVWRPDWREMRPGELLCSPETALDRQGTVPPH